MNPELKAGQPMRTRGTRFLPENTHVTLIAGGHPRYGNKWLVRVTGRNGIDAHWYVEESCLVPAGTT